MYLVCFQTYKETNMIIISTYPHISPCDTAFMYKTVLLITESYYNVNSYFKYTQQLVQMGARNVSLLTAIYNLYRSTAYFQFLSAQ